MDMGLIFLNSVFYVISSVRTASVAVSRMVVVTVQPEKGSCRQIRKTFSLSRESEGGHSLEVIVCCAPKKSGGRSKTLTRTVNRHRWAGRVSSGA